jgi:hypothetical protein
MAIDTAAKRRAVATLAFMVFAPGITPDATPDQFWRQTAGYGYGGILADSPVENDGLSPQIVVVGFLVNCGNPH